jgi:Fe-S cluster biosynthesis and repair protein YggX
MKTEKPKLSPEEQKNNFQLLAMKFQLELGEMGDDIVRMVTQYVEQGWMEWDQATMMLKDILEPGCDD